MEYILARTAPHAPYPPYTTVQHRSRRLDRSNHSRITASGDLVFAAVCSLGEKCAEDFTLSLQLELRSRARADAERAHAKKLCAAAGLAVAAIEHDDKVDLPQTQRKQQCAVRARSATGQELHAGRETSVHRRRCRRRHSRQRVCAENAPPATHAMERAAAATDFESRLRR